MIRMCFPALAVRGVVTAVGTPALTLTASSRCALAEVPVLTLDIRVHDTGGKTATVSNLATS